MIFAEQVGENIKDIVIQEDKLVLLFKDGSATVIMQNKTTGDFDVYHARYKETDQHMH